jgi:hypothetical protein
MRHALYLLLIPLALGSACGARQAAATQNAALVFDATKSDPKALAIADQVLAAVGGADNWNKAHEIIWLQGIVEDGKLVSARRHAWDRWNGRHQYLRLNMDGGASITMHELFDDTAHAFAISPEGQKLDVMRADKKKMVEEANRAFYTDSYLLAIQFKLRDPGVHLAFAEERPEEGERMDAEKKYDVLKITFDKGVGPTGDTYYLVVSKKTHLPTMIERVAEGNADNVRAGFKLDHWTDAGGLKFAALRTTMGPQKDDGKTVPLTIPKEWEEQVPLAGLQVPAVGELVILGDVQVHPDPEDGHYVPDVTKQ